MKPVLTFDVKEGTEFCCGLAEIGGFMVEPYEEDDDYSWGEGNYFSSETKWPPEEKDKAFFATTTRSQVSAGRRLKRMGFKKLGSWTRNTGVKLYLWGYFPKRRVKKKRKK